MFTLIFVYKYESTTAAVAEWYQTGGFVVRAYNSHSDSLLLLDP